MDSLMVLLIQQVIVMLLLMITGLYLYRKTIINRPGASQMSTLALYLATPATILSAFITEYSAERLRNGLLVGMLFFLSMVLSIAVAKTLFRNQDRLIHFAVTFGNVGFMGIPLVEAILGQEYVFYMSLVVAVQNLMVFTYGVWILSGNSKEASLHKFLLNPNTLAVVFGLLISWLRIPVPYVLRRLVSLLAQLNAPLAMIVLGCYLGSLDFAKVMKNQGSISALAGKLLISPFVTLVMLRLFPWGNYNLNIVVLLAAATPVAGALGMLAEKYDKDFAYGSGIIAVSTVLSLLTMPMWIYLMEIL